jgi:hypothetical protein
MHRKTKSIANTEGNLALASKPLLPTPGREFKLPALRLVQGLKGHEDLFEEPFVRLKQLLLAIDLSIVFCLLWVFVVYMLYRVVRSTVAVYR